MSDEIVTQGIGDATGWGEITGAPLTVNAPVAKPPTLASQLISQLERHTDAVHDLDITLDGVHVEAFKFLVALRGFVIAGFILAVIACLFSLSALLVLVYMVGVGR